MTRPVIVGYDQTPSSERALTEAAGEAASRGTTLTILHAYHHLPPTLPKAFPPAPPPSARKAAEQIADAAATSARNRHPDLQVETRTVAGSAAEALAEAAHGAQLIVIGNRSHGGFASLLRNKDHHHGMSIGPVTDTLLHHAACPVAVVPLHAELVHTELVQSAAAGEVCRLERAVSWRPVRRQGHEPRTRG